MKYHRTPITGAVSVAAVPLIAVTVAITTAQLGRADDAPPHEVIYSVTADHAVAVRIYYRDVQPATWADYSHNPYQFSPRDDTDLAPGASWIHKTTLSDPAEWAMVTVTTADQSPQGDQHLHCTLTIDGNVVDRSDGPRGALCSLRNW